MFGMASGERFWQRRPFDGVLKLLESKFMVYNYVLIRYSISISNQIQCCKYYNFKYKTNKKSLMSY